MERLDLYIKKSLPIVRDLERTGNPRRVIRKELWRILFENEGKLSGLPGEDLRRVLEAEIGRRGRIKE